MNTLTELLSDELVVRVPRPLRDQATRLVRSGRAVRLLPGILALPEAADDWRAMAVGIQLRDPDAVLTGNVAARLSFDPTAGPIPITFATQRNMRRLPAGFSATERTILPAFRCAAGPLTITTPAMTALDLATEADASPIDLVLRTRSATLGQIRAALDQTPFRAGNTERRQVVLDSAMEPWSEAERMLHRIMRRLSLRHPWYSNHRVQVAGQTYFIDVAVPASRLAIEADGYEFHSSREAFERDRSRQNQLIISGWKVLRFTWRQLHEDPVWCGEQILRALRA